MHAEVKALLLILVANSAPILISLVPYVDKLSYPLDGKFKFFDGRRWLGDNKTWRGVIAAMLATSICAVVIQSGWILGLIVGVLAMLGDSISSFMKRRLAMTPSAMALGIDQVPESLLPLIYLQYRWSLDWYSVLLVVLLFAILEIILSRILFRLHIRKRPY